MRTRVLEPERMDDPALPAAEHHHALAGLRRINAICMTHRRLLGLVRSLTRSRPGDSIRVLDLACGSGDAVRYMAGHAAATGLSWHITGLDRSAVVVDEARRLTPASLRDHVSFSVGDALDDLDAHAADIVTCSLFLHHLTDEDVVRLFRGVYKKARIGFAAQDLVRSRTGYWLARAGTRLLSRSHVVLHDGPQSVRAAWTVEEMRTLLETSGMGREHTAIMRIFPERMLIRWARHD
ncbi:MAG: methyltransferase domain-containing protein [Phycisphaeraceae bacterium]